MAVVISEIVTEVVVGAPATPGSAAPAPATGLPEDAMDDVVRRAAERVLEVLRREWDL